MDSSGISVHPIIEDIRVYDDVRRSVHGYKPPLAVRARSSAIGGIVGHCQHGCGHPGRADQFGRNSGPAATLYHG